MLLLLSSKHLFLSLMCLAIFSDVGDHCDASLLTSEALMSSSRLTLSFKQAI